jgi:apolipoprotein N-acyltransferase
VVRSEVTVSDRIGDAPEYAAAVLLLLLAGGARWQASRNARVVPHPRTEEEAAVV